jgi:enediyne biosynthesis thioesterase
MPAYEYRHVVSFEETNLVGNVYYANHVRWQGRVREMFLRDHAPDIIRELGEGLSMVTTRVFCEYYSELFAFDEVLIRMSVAEVTQSRVTMRYEYLCKDQLMARGEQQIACLRKEGERMVTAPVPQSLRNALLRFAEPGIVVV